MRGMLIADVPVDAKPLRERLAWLIEQDPAQVAAFASRPASLAGRGWLKTLVHASVDTPPPWGGWVPIVAASVTSGEIGRLGFVQATLQFTDRPEHPAGEGGSESESTAEAVRNAYATRHLAEVLGRRSLSLDTLVPAGAGGDSLALSCAAAAVAAALEGAIDPRTAFSGGWATHDRREAFATPAPETLESKLRCLAAWGIARLVVPEGTVLPADRHGIEIVEVCPDASLLASELVARGILKDLRPSGIASVINLIDRQSGSGRAVPAACRKLLAAWAGGSDPLAKALAADLLGREALHAGRTDEAMTRFSVADACELSPLPESPIREQWRFERRAVRQIAMIDTGHLADDPELPPVAAAHAAADRAIAQLCDDNLTRHEWFMRFILQNNRARRWEYLGRLYGDAAHLDRAWADLTAEHGRWDELVAIAADDLGRRDTSRHRVENQCIDVLRSRQDLADHEPSQGPVPPEWLELVRSFERSRSAIAGLQGFDLLGWLKLRSVLDGGVDAADLRTAAETLGMLGGGDGGNAGAGSGGGEGHGMATALGYPDFISLEWLLRLDRDRTLPTERIAATLEQSIRQGTEGDGVFRVLMLRSAAVLELHADRSSSLKIVPESAIASLRAMQIVVVGDGTREGVLRRCPY